MVPTDQQIAETVERLAQGQFDAMLDWNVCYELVLREVTRRRLPARNFAPTSRFGGTDWTKDDFTALAGEWISLFRGDRARRLLGVDHAIAHVANAARRSIYYLVLGQARRTPQCDLWAAVKDALPEFISLTTGDPRPNWTVPEELFPWQQTERTERQRAVTKDEVRTALRIIQSQQPSGWSFEDLFTCLKSWTGAADTSEQSLDGLDIGEPPENDHHIEAVDSISIGRETAQALLRELKEHEKAILLGFIVPNGLGTVTLKEAAATLGMKKSTLDDHAKRLRDKLAATEHGEVITMDAAARRAFLEELCATEFGKPASEPSNE